MPGLTGHKYSAAGLHTSAAPSWHRPARPDAPERQQRQQRRCIACTARSNSSEPKSAPGLAGIPQPTELRLIRGVGPKNEALLLSKGHATIHSLQTVFQESLDADLAKLKSYLEGKVGIRRLHSTYIAQHIAQTAQQSTEADEHALQPRRLTLSVEGNISSGKSTFLDMILEARPELKETVHVAPEPVDKWQRCGPNNFNILNAFYREPQRFAYTFQNFVFLSRILQEAESSHCPQPMRLLERSVFCDRMVFVKAMVADKLMSEDELSIYDAWYNGMVDAMPTLRPDGFIYLRAEPQTCLSRMMRRDRSEEAGVSLQYLTGLHQRHDDWLYDAEQLAGVKSSLDEAKAGGMESQLANVPEIIRDKITFLRKSAGLHPQVEGLPALVLDHDKDIDLERDIEAKRYYADCVASYFEFAGELQRKQRATRALMGLSDASQRVAQLKESVLTQMQRHQQLAAV